MNNNLLIDAIDEHHRAVMMNHVPPPIVVLKHVGDEEGTSVHVQVCFHCNPGHVG